MLCVIGMNRNLRTNQTNSLLNSTSFVVIRHSFTSGQGIPKKRAVLRCSLTTERTSWLQRENCTRHHRKTVLFIQPYIPLIRYSFRPNPKTRQSPRHYNPPINVAAQSGRLLYFDRSQSPRGVTSLPEPRQQCTPRGFPRCRSSASADNTNARDTNDLNN